LTLEWLNIVERRSLHTSITNNGRFTYYNIHRKSTNPKHQNENHFENEALKFEFDAKYIDNICEVWTEKMSVQRELLFKKDDKLIKHDSNYWLPKVQPLTLKSKYQEVQALKDAPDAVKKIFSVEYGERYDLTDVWKKIITEKVQPNPLDEKCSLESRIARKTANIRQKTMLLESMTQKPGWLRKYIRLAVEKRRKYLRLLRYQDEDSFENVLSQLKIAYHVSAMPEDLPKHTRKGWVENIVKQKCELIKEEKLRRYHATLKKDHESFMQKREKSIKELTEEMDRLKVELEVLKAEDGTVLEVKGQYIGDTIGEVSEHLMLNYFYRKPSRESLKAAN